MQSSKLIKEGGKKCCKDSKRALKTEIVPIVHELQDLLIYVNELIVSLMDQKSQLNFY